MLIEEEEEDFSILRGEVGWGYRQDNKPDTNNVVEWLSQSTITLILCRRFPQTFWLWSSTHVPESDEKLNGANASSSHAKFESRATGSLCASAAQWRVVLTSQQRLIPSLL
jgi:hypothetical protein